MVNNINAILLGARSVDPSITCQVFFTGERSLVVKEAKAKGGHDAALNIVLMQGGVFGAVSDCASLIGVLS